MNKRFLIKITFLIIDIVSRRCKRVHKLNAVRRLFLLDFAFYGCLSPQWIKTVANRYLFMFIINSSESILLFPFEP